MRRHGVLPLLYCLLLAACASAPPRASAPARVPVLLVSLDGVHPDYLRRGLTPTLAGLARDGVQAQAMRPSYPSLTFPNHYTLVTGLRPDRHGIVENSMQDPVLGHFTMGNRTAVEDGRWWGGEPLWVSAERAGLHTATMFWPGSEADILGVRPREWQRFSYDVTIPTRIATVLDWTARTEPPALMTLYFEHVDRAGHDFGPGSPEVDAALRQVDAALAELLRGLRRQARAVNLVIVSDHGMSALSTRRIVFIDDLVDLDRIDLRDTGATVLLAPRAGHEREVEAALLGARDHIECWRKSELPARWHYGSHPRIAPIVCQVAPGWYAITRAQFARWNGKLRGGTHGYDPAHPDMAAIFIANGPAFERGVTLPPFDNVDVYPLLARLLGLTPLAHDGDARVLQPALRPDP